MTRAIIATLMILLLGPSVASAYAPSLNFVNRYNKGEVVTNAFDPNRPTICDQNSQNVCKCVFDYVYPEFTSNDSSDAFRLKDLNNTMTNYIKEHDICSASLEKLGTFKITYKVLYNKNWKLSVVFTREINEAGKNREVISEVFNFVSFKGGQAIRLSEIINPQFYAEFNDNMYNKLKIRLVQQLGSNAMQVIGDKQYFDMFKLNNNFNTYFYYTDKSIMFGFLGLLNNDRVIELEVPLIYVNQGFMNF